MKGKNETKKIHLYTVNGVMLLIRGVAILLTTKSASETKQ